MEPFGLIITCQQVSQMKPICHGLSSLLSRVGCLDLYEAPNIADIGSPPWLDFFRSFIAAQTLHVSQGQWHSVALALRELTGERTTEMLPSLRTLVFEKYQPRGSIVAALEPFIAARQLCGHPVAIRIG
jgi:hypothetical protein